jgi:phage minor structural protein
VIIIKNGERQIYHPQNPNLMLLNPKLSLEDNGAGQFTFQIYKNNLNYSTVKKLYPLISVIRDDRTIFKGRVISDKKDFQNGKYIETEGKLAFLNDSYMEPFSFSGSPADLFCMIIENHNMQVKDWQQFKAGEVTVIDNNDYIVRSSENCINSWDALKEKCFQSSLGGHIRIRYEKDGDYIDWLADYDTISAQHIEFAKNILDISSQVDATETYTAIRPIGAEVDGEKVDISSVNDGKNYLINEEKADEYGIIYAPESESTWPDVTLPENLLKKAKDKLYGSFATLRETYEIKAVDLHLTDTQIQSLNIYTYVPVVSKPHGIDGRYLLYKADMDITSPQNTVYYLGATKRTLSDSHMIQYGAADIPKDISAFHNDAGYVSEEKAAEILSEYSRTEEVETMVIKYVETIPAGKDGENGLSAYEMAVEQGFNGNETEWLESLKGSKGDTGDQGDPGKSGKDGAEGRSAYELAVEEGFNGSLSEWLMSLKGEKGDVGDFGNHEILAAEDAIRSNTEAGKLVDALVIKDIYEKGIGGGNTVFVLGYEESLFYLNSDEEKEPTGGSAVSATILSYEDTLSFLDSNA